MADNNKRAKEKKPGQRKSNKSEIIGVILALVSFFFLLCLFTILFSDIGEGVKKLFTGLLGYFAYALFLVTEVIGCMLLFKAKIVLSKKRIAFIVVSCLLFLCILQLVTSGANLDVGISDYIAAVYEHNEAKTAGGVLFGIFAYAAKAALSKIGAYIFFSLILALVLVFLVLDIIRARKPMPANKRSYQKNKTAAADFIKSGSEAAPVTRIINSGLYVGQIVPKENRGHTESGAFSEIITEGGGRGKAEVVGEKKQAATKNLGDFFASLKEDTREEKQRLDAKQVLFGNTDQLGQDSKARFLGKTNISHETPRDTLAPKMPQKLEASPDIKPDARQEPEVPFKKALRPEVVFPPAPEVQPVFYSGEIIDAAAASDLRKEDKPEKFIPQNNSFVDDDYDFSSEQRRSDNFLSGRQDLNAQDKSTLPEPNLVKYYNPSEIINCDEITEKEKAAKNAAAKDADFYSRKPTQPPVQKQSPHYSYSDKTKNDCFELPLGDVYREEYDAYKPFNEMRAEPENARQANKPQPESARQTNKTQPESVRPADKYQSESAYQANKPQPESVRQTNKPQPDNSYSSAENRESGLKQEVKPAGQEYFKNKPFVSPAAEPVFDVAEQAFEEEQNGGFDKKRALNADMATDKMPQSNAGFSEQTGYGRNFSDLNNREKTAAYQEKSAYQEKPADREKGEEKNPYQEKDGYSEVSKNSAVYTDSYFDNAADYADKNIKQTKGDKDYNDGNDSYFDGAKNEDAVAADANEPAKYQDEVLEKYKAFDVFSDDSEDADKAVKSEEYEEAAMESADVLSEEEEYTETADIEDAESFYETVDNESVKHEKSAASFKVPPSSLPPLKNQQLMQDGQEDNADYTGYYIRQKPQASFSDRAALLDKKIDPKNQINIENYLYNTVGEAQPAKPRKKRVRYVPPPVELLTSQSTNPEDYNEDYQANAAMLEETLRELKLPAKVIGITRGPAVTRYELEMPPGYTVKRMEGLSQDIAYALASSGGIRIEAPIPGKRAVGVEVPNRTIGIVGLREMIESQEFIKATGNLSLCIGKDIAGKPVVCNLEKMPHLLIAGSTNSGKSACLHSLIISMIYKSSPADVRLILIDPKRVEFPFYKGLRHLMINNIVNEREHAINVFKWVREEMEERYKLLAKYNARNLQEYNSSAAVKSGEAEQLPNLVIIVDELSDLMIGGYKKEMEEHILSIAQKARASGVNLILATQRPSVDVITGTIKINLPSRIALAVSSAVDSKTILDQSGAEMLLGRGDLLFAPIDAADPKRIQGAYVTKEEVEAVVAFVNENNPEDFYEEAEQKILRSKDDVAEEGEETEANDDGYDALLEEVARKVIETNQASTSMMQRRFKLGYARASRIIDQMERAGFIGPMDVNRPTKPREVYITREMFKEFFGKDY